MVQLTLILTIVSIWGFHRVDSKALLFQHIDVCRNWLGYVFLGYFPGCYFDHNVLAPTSTLITRYNYESEKHKVVTPDGYILSVHRIVPKSPNSTVVVLMHSMLTNSASFLALKRDSLAFMLADCGLDVILPDIRGTEYSMEHMNLTINNEKFWDYSIDEIAKYDVPTILEFVEKLTGQRQVIVIGHGFGNTPVFMYSSTNPEASRERIKMLIALGPITEQRNNNFWAWSKYLRPFYRPTWYTLKMLHMSKLVSYYDYQRNTASILFYSYPYVFIRFLIVSFGKDDQITPEIIPFFVNHFFSGGSFKSFVHGTQLAKAFARFDYGKTMNMKMYGLEQPPLYNVSKIVHPVYLISSDDDAVSDKTDSILLYTALSDQARSYGRFQIVRPKVNQQALVFGKDAAALIYNNILDLIGSISGNQAKCQRAIKQRQETPAIEGPKHDEMMSSLIKGAKDMFKKFQTQDKPTKPIDPTNKFNFNLLDLMKTKGKIDDKVILSPTGDKNAQKAQKEKVDGLEKHLEDSDESTEKDQEKSSNLNDMIKSAFGWVKDKMQMLHLPEINLGMMDKGADSSEEKHESMESPNRDPILVPNVSHEKLVDTASYKAAGLSQQKSYKDPDPHSHNKIPDKIAGSDMRPRVLIKPPIVAANEKTQGEVEGSEEKDKSEESSEKLKELTLKKKAEQMKQQEKMKMAQQLKLKKELEEHKHEEESEEEKHRKKRSPSEHHQLEELAKKQEHQEKKLDEHIAKAKQYMAHKEKEDHENGKEMKEKLHKEMHQTRQRINENAGDIRNLAKTQKVAENKQEDLQGSIKGFFNRIFG